jgi:hypothetical protein
VRRRPAGVSRAFALASFTIGLGPMVADECLRVGLRQAGLLATSEPSQAHSGHSEGKGPQAIRDFARAMRGDVGNMPPLPGVFPDYAAPIVRNAEDGERALVMARWGMPSPQSALRGATLIRASRTSATYYPRWDSTISATSVISLRRPRLAAMLRINGETCVFTKPAGV